MPLPLSRQQIEAAVDSALEDVGVIPVQVEAVEALKEAGADVRRLSAELANLIFSAKDPTKLKAILHAFALHGIDLEPKSNTDKSITIHFNVVGDNTCLNNLFAPER